MGSINRSNNTYHQDGRARSSLVSLAVVGLVLSLLALAGCGQVPGYSASAITINKASAPAGEEVDAVGALAKNQTEQAALAEAEAAEAAALAEAEAEAAALAASQVNQSDGSGSVTGGEASSTSGEAGSGSEGTSSSVAQSEEACLTDVLIR
ncbi:MAG: hypothetical protein LBU07_01385 [Coriobacteriales bacterium]|jgi:hypothetical protein|nr:hypothetical protein [Coriobacteriales bacterium]